MTKENNENNPANTEFQGDLTDGRKSGNWETRYSEKTAIDAIKWEKGYLIILFSIVLFVSFSFGLYFKGYFFSITPFNSSSEITGSIL